MSSVVDAIPDVNPFLALEPEELGAKLLFLAKAGQKFDGAMFNPSSFESDIWEAETRQEQTYPRNRRGEITLAFSEAWAWLEAQGLIVRAAETNGHNGWRVLSRRARRFESEAEFANYSVARMLQREILHQKLADKVWMAFMRGEFDAAVFQAMKAVEVAVRAAAGLPDGLIGTKLMQAAFAIENGPLADMSAEAG